MSSGLSNWSEYNAQEESNEATDVEDKAGCVRCTAIIMLWICVTFC